MVTYWLFPPSEPKTMELAMGHTQRKLGIRRQDGEEKGKTKAPIFLLISGKLKHKWLCEWGAAINITNLFMLRSTHLPFFPVH